MSSLLSITKPPRGAEIASWKILRRSFCCLHHPSSGRSDVNPLCSAMMLFLLKTVITVLALLATCVLVPQLPLGLLRFVLRGVGWVIQKRTRSRRELVLSRVRIEDEEFQARRSKSSSGGSGEDEDWEKVDSSSSGSGTAGHKQTGRDEDWNGIIGFFHPFWYGWTPSLCPEFFRCICPARNARAELLTISPVKQQRRRRRRTCSLGSCESYAKAMAQGHLRHIYRGS